MDQSQSQHGLRVLIAWLLVCILWGSTYLAMAVGVRYIEAAMFTGVRFSVAGLLLLAYCAISRRRVVLGARDLFRLAVIGILLLSIANPMLVWAEKVVPSGLAALLVAVVPLWLMVFDALIRRTDRVSRAGYLGLAMGIIGVAVLVWPKIVAGGALNHRQLIGFTAVLVCSCVWAAGSVLSKHWHLTVDPLSGTAWQMVIAGAVDLGHAFLRGEPRRAQWTWQGTGAIAYLIVFGSLIGYCAYIWLLSNAPVSKVGTYAYVNPVIAVFLGWLVLRERVDAYVVAGSAIILMAVAIVTGSKVQTREGRTILRELPASDGPGD